ncbi:type II toxin-antitoxin system RelE/ParE family toxin [Advenella sp. WQ 585]|uniref:Type II toxin-antitoxin system RelE/ParE family toxin n=1 Tax=Advenella mandrilli TaxID=2800330 RepID=A0ABS1EGE3_9BURK|nr:type II toxin-antitoxin system RelE/ParE family toxin [Advenella mandrilli]
MNWIHGFIKKSQGTPKKELALATERLKQSQRS